MRDPQAAPAAPLTPRADGDKIKIRNSRDGLGFSMRSKEAGVEIIDLDERYLNTYFVCLEDWS
jgi:hypothetical protein